MTYAPGPPSAKLGLDSTARVRVLLQPLTPRFTPTDSSVGKESACTAGDPGSIPGSGRSPGEEIGYPLQYSWASLVSRWQGIRLQVGGLGSIPGLGRSPGGGHGNPLQYSCLENPHGQRGLAGYSPWGHKESDTTD